MNIGNHKGLIINLIAIIVFFIIAFFVFSSWLNSYTDHGESVEVPNLAGLDFEAATILAEKNDLKVKINDTLCVEYSEPGTVVDHFPMAGKKVKRGRTIYVSINSDTPLMVIMPKITDMSLREATHVLENKGLKVGEIAYKPYPYDTYVLEQKYRSQIVEAGTKVPKGSAINLTVGKADEETFIPMVNLINYNWQQLCDSAQIKGFSFNAIFPATILTLSDTLACVAYRQSPVYKADAVLNPAVQIDVWFHIPTESLEE